VSVVVVVVVDGLTTATPDSWRENINVVHIKVVEKTGDQLCTVKIIFLGMYMHLKNTKAHKDRVSQPSNFVNRTPFVVKWLAHMTIPTAFTSSFSMILFTNKVISYVC
jgi:hypothetical protein